jgi:HAD superfamily hydrolase (TIGR01509 family)
MRIKAILFDIDGTLVDSNDMHVLAWKEAFDGVGRSFGLQTIHDQIGKGADMLIPALMPAVTSEEQKKLGDAHGEVFKARFLDRVEPFPRAHEIIAHARDRGQLVALASSASQAELDHYLGLLDARALVVATTSSADVQNTKPAPDIFSVALAKLPGVDAAEAIVVGDTPYDVEAAKKVGIATVALRSGGFPDDALTSAGAIAIYDDVAALLEDYERSPLGG